MADIHWSWHAFAELTPFQLYDALALREKAFTFEQACTEVDLDDVDQHCQHLLGYDGNTLAVGEPYDEGGIDHVCMSYGKR